VKPKVCDARKGGCGETFTPARQMQKACSPECARRFAEHVSAKTKALRERQDKVKTRAALEALKTVPRLKKEAQHAFNRWIRQRDAEQPCISCGAPPPDLSALHAGRDAGHYRSTGSADHLRFNEDNCHAQCVSCNQWGAGKAVEYRMGLLARIGPERTNALEFNRDFVKWTREGLREIRDKYRAMWTKGKHLEKS
jgi:hypothetical protein